MTWEGVATAGGVSWVAVGVVLGGCTGIVAVGVGLVTLLALFEYFALGEAIGHRAYRFWTATCALVLVYVQWFAAIAPAYGLPRRLAFDRGVDYVFRVSPTVPDVFFLFVLGVAVLTLWTKRPLVEALPPAGISGRGLLLIAFPLSYAVRLHGLRFQGPALLLFAMLIICVGSTAAYFVGRSFGKYKLAPHLSPNKTWEGTVASFVGSLIVAVLVYRFMTVPLPHSMGVPAVGNVAGEGGAVVVAAYK